MLARLPLPLMMILCLPKQTTRFARRCSIISRRRHGATRGHSPAAIWAPCRIERQGQQAAYRRHGLYTRDEIPPSLLRRVSRRFTRAMMAFQPFDIKRRFADEGKHFFSLSPSVVLWHWIARIRPSLIVIMSAPRSSTDTRYAFLATAWCCFISFTL